MNEPKTTALDVAAFILDRLGPMTTMKLQKLVYYCQAWHLAWRSKPLFDEQIEAWANGPVCPALFAKHRGRYSLSSIAGGDPSRVNASQIMVIDRVLEAYGPLEAGQLSRLTHAERPWRDAMRIAGSSVIGHRAMKDYYENMEGTRVEEIDWPGR